MPRQLVLENTPIFIAAALVLMGLLVWRVKPSTFYSLRWQSIGIASALFWSLLAVVLISFAWDSYYTLFVPSWYRLAAPVGAIMLYALLGQGIRWVAVNLPGHPVITFCFLGGLESIPEHAIAIYRFDILQIPLLRGDTPTAIFIFAFFEYIVFWSITLYLAIGINRLLVRFEAGNNSIQEGK